MSFSIKEKSVIVTGAANGIGLSIARHFVDQGAFVMLTDIEKDKLIAEVETLGKETDQVGYFAGDLREKLTHENLLSATLEQFDDVDVLVNASRQVLTSDALNAKKDNFEIMMQQNVVNTLRLTQLIAGHMIEAHQTDDHRKTRGAIINLSSIAADRAHPDLMAYSVSSAALNQLTRSLAVSLAQNRIRVNAIAIGSVLSNSLQDALREAPEKREALIAATPLGHIAQADRVAELAQVLAADSSEFITGQVINIDGGRSLIDPAPVAAH